MRMSPSMSWVLVAVGVLFTVVVFIDLGMRGTHRSPPEPHWMVRDGDIQRGRQAIVDYGCGACHVIPGIRDATGRVGPRLTGFREQTYIAGHLANVPENLIRWIQDPREVAPGTAMPNLGVSEQEARDIAAYLYSSR